MTYTWFYITLGFLSLVGFLIGLLLVDNKKNFGTTLSWLTGALVLWCCIGAPVYYTDFYGNFEDPVCLEFKGHAPISFVWNKDEPGVYINDEPYLLKDYMRNYGTQIDELEDSWYYDSIPRIDSIQVYRYEYGKLLGFIKPSREDFIFVHRPDNYVIYGNCKQRLNQLQVD